MLTIVVAIVGRPVARGLQDGRTAEVTRVCVLVLDRALPRPGLALPQATRLGHEGAPLPGGPAGQRLWAIYHPSGVLRMREVDPARAEEMVELAIAALRNAVGYVEHLAGVVAEVGQVSHG